MENNKYKTLAEALIEFGWFHLDNIQTSNYDAINYLKTIFDPTELDSEGQPKIITKNITIIVCDNHDFNETYLIDLVSNVLRKQNYKIGTYDLILVDNICARSYIKNPKFIPYYMEKEWKTIEKNQLSPCIIVINPTHNVMVQMSEQPAIVLNEENIEYLLKYADNIECKKLISSNK